MGQVNIRKPTKFAAVTPSDTTTLSGVSGLWVGGTGTLVLQGQDGAPAVTLVAVGTGVFVDCSPLRVMAATTATLIVAFFD